MTETPDRNHSIAAAGPADTTSELWDRIADDLDQRGRICAETVEKLVDEACRRPAGSGDGPDQVG